MGYTEARDCENEPRQDKTPKEGVLDLTPILDLVLLLISLGAIGSGLLGRAPIEQIGAGVIAAILLAASVIGHAIRGQK